MFCGNCGNKVDDNISFCPYCGAPIENSSGSTRKYNLKAILKILIPVFVVALFAFAGIKIFTYFKSKPTEAQLLAEVNNYQNGGIVTSDGTWLYYNDNGLCKMLLKDGSKQKVISNDISPEKMYLVGDHIYYFSNLGLHKTKIGNPKEENLDFLSVFSEDCFQIDGKNYYVSGLEDNHTEGVFSVKANNYKKTKQLLELHPTKILMYRDYLYVISGFGTINDEPNENYGTWRIDKNGKNKIALMGICPEYMVFSGDTIYFSDADGTLCSMDLDGAQQERYNGIIINEGLNVTDEYVFYLTYEDDWDNTTIHRVNKDGTNDVELNKENSKMINIIGDWLFYINYDQGGEIYRMSFDGEYNEPIY